MSGHSHFSSIKHKKEANDAQRGRTFSKLTREIIIASRFGIDPETNNRLRVVIEKAKSMNMPKDNIERAIKKGSGETEGARLEEVLFEAYGPAGVAILIQGITDNNKRTLGEVKQILNQYGGKFVESGSVKWLFERKGVIEVSAAGIVKEELELKAIEAGAEDTLWHEEMLEIYTKPEDLEKVKKLLEAGGVKIDSAGLGWVPKEEIKAEEKNQEACQRLFEALDENEAITDVYSNLA